MADEKLEPPPSDHAQKAAHAFNELVGKSQGDLTHLGYLAGSYTDAEGRLGNDVRLVRSADDPTSFTLNMNLGEPLALVEIHKKLKDKGVRVNKLVAHLAKPEEQDVLDSLTKSK